LITLLKRLIANHLYSQQGSQLSGRFKLFSEVGGSSLLILSILCSILESWISFLTSVPAYSLSLVSASLVLLAFALKVRQFPFTLKVVFSLFLSFLALKVLLSTGEIEVAFSGIARMLMLPSILLIAAYSTSKDALNSLIAIRIFGIAQIPLLLLNEAGELTPVELGDPFSEQDRYQGLFVNSGPYLSFVALLIWFAVEFVRKPIWQIGVPCLMVAFVLAYWTENRLFNISIGLSAASFLILRGHGKGARAIPLFGLALAVFLGSVYLSIFLEPRTWGQYSEGSKGITAIFGSTEAGVDDSTVLGTNAQIQNRAQALAYVLNSYPSLNRKVWFGVPIGEGLSQTGFQASRKISSNNSEHQGLISSKASPSVAVGPHSSSLGMLTEFGLVGSALYVAFAILTLWALARSLTRLAFVVFIPSLVFLWVTSPVLEGHILTAAVGIALIASQSVNSKIKLEKVLTTR